MATGKAAAEDQLIRFAIVRLADNACEPTCPEWILAEGSIDAKAPARLKAVLKEAGGRTLPVLLSSRGGDAEAAMALGRLIRKSRLVVVVGRTALEGCQFDEKTCTANDGKGAHYRGEASTIGGECMWECTLVLAGGVRRIAGSDTYAGRIAAGSSNKSGKRVQAYLKEMDVDPVLLEAVPSEIFGLDRQRALHGAHLLTSILTLDPAAFFVGSNICRETPAPDNCRVFTTADLD